MSFKTGDLVWAKMKGCPYWPARVIKPDQKVKQPKSTKVHQLVCFFGTDDIAWIANKYIIPHTTDVFETDIAKNKSRPLQHAIEDFKEYLALPVGDLQPPSSTIREKKLVDETKPSESGKQVQGSHRRKAMAKANDKKYGFIGLTETGAAVLERFIRCGMDITLWNNANNYENFTAKGKKVNIANSPAELICKCDITFCCLELDNDGFENSVLGENGILKGFEEAEKLGRRPGYVGLARVDPEMSKQIQNCISTRNGMYLDSPIVIYECAETFDNCKVYVSAAGDKELFDDCEKCFKIISEDYFYASYDIEVNSNANMLFNAISGTTHSALSEAMVLADRTGIFKDDSVNKIIPFIFDVDTIVGNAERMGQDGQNSQTVTPLKQVQENMNLALQLADEICQPMPIATAANEMYKHAKLLSDPNADVSAIFKSLKR